MQRTAILFLATALSLTAAVAAGDEARSTLAPGDPRIGALEPFEARYAMTRAEQPWAKASITLRAERLEGAAALRHAYAMDFESQTVYDETLVVAASLAPRLKFIHGGLPPELAYKVYTFVPGRVAGSTVYADGRDAAVVGRETGSAVFATGTDYLAVASMPTGPGFATKLSVADDAMTVERSLRFARHEQLQLAGRTWKATVIAVDDGQAEWWLVDEPPYLLRKKFPAAGIQWELVRFRTKGRDR